MISYYQTNQKDYKDPTENKVFRSQAKLRFLSQERLQEDKQWLSQLLLLVQNNEMLDVL